ncbi:MAG: lysylphosphatidylglycerol synthase domain-containing protein [Candidatus Hodarchaeales archaeon]
MNNKLKLILTFILIIITLIYFQSIDWKIFFSNIPNLRMEFFYISSIFAIGAFIADAIIWYYFLKPLSPSEIHVTDVIGINFFSVMAGVIIPSGGAVDVAVKMKYVKDTSSLSYEKILATILAVRIIFIITLYPTIAIFAYILLEFNIVPVEVVIGLLLFAFLILTLILFILVLIISKVDFFNTVLVKSIFYLLNKITSPKIVFILVLYLIVTIMTIFLIFLNILSIGEAFIILSTILFILTITMLFFIKYRPLFFQNNFFSKSISQETFTKLEQRIIKSSNSFAKSFRLLKGSKKYWHLILFYTCVFWVLRLLTMFYIFLVLRDFEFHVIIVTATIGSFTTMIPAFLPGMVGIRDIIVTETLTILSEITKEDSFLTSAMNQVQTLILFLISFIGFFFIQRKSRKLIEEEK